MPDKTEKQKILVIKLGALGDFIQSLGPMRAIRTHHPDADITLLTTAPFAELARLSGYFNKIEIDTRPKFYQFKQWRKLKNRLNDAGYARVYDLQNNDRTAIYFRLFKSPRPEWVGIAKGASHRNTSPERIAGLAFYGHVQTLGLAGISPVSIDRLEWIENDISHFNLPSPYALIVPGSAPSRPEKRWPAEKYAQLCHQLLQKNITPVLLGTKDEEIITSEILAACPKATNLNNQTSLLDIPQLARNATFAIGNDTGPMHIIAPTGCKTLVLFSKHSNPVRHAPLGERILTLQNNDLKNLSVDDVMTQINLL